MKQKIVFGLIISCTAPAFATHESFVIRKDGENLVFAAFHSLKACVEICKETAPSDFEYCVSTCMSW